MFFPKNKLVPKHGHVIILSNTGTHILVMGQDKGRIGGIWLPPSKKKYRFSAILNGQQKDMKVLVTDVEQTLDLRFYDDTAIPNSKPVFSPANKKGTVSLDDLMRLQRY